MEIWNGAHFFPFVNRVFFLIISLGRSTDISFTVAVLQTLIIQPVSEWSWAKPPTPEVVCLFEYLISQEAEDSFCKLQSFTILSVSVIPLSSLSIPCGAEWEKPEYRTVLYYAEVYFYVQYGTQYFKLMGFFLSKWMLWLCIFAWIFNSFELYVWLVFSIRALVCL